MLQSVKARSVVVLASITSAIVLVGGMWFLEGTRLGQELRCRLFDDVGACLRVALQELAEGVDAQPPPQPRPTESPEERAAREAREQQEALERRVAAASDELRLAIDELRAHADELLSYADEALAGAEGVEDAVRQMQSVYDELRDAASRRPLTRDARDDMAFLLDDVVFARDDVSFAADDVTFGAESYELEREDYESAYLRADAALDELMEIVASDPSA